MDAEGLMAMLQGAPLRSILRFAGPDLPLPEGVNPRQYIDYLLAQVHETDG
jgi:hypothetical protein